MLRYATLNLRSPQTRDLVSCVFPKSVYEQGSSLMNISYLHSSAKAIVSANSRQAQVPDPAIQKRIISASRSARKANQGSTSVCSKAPLAPKSARIASPTAGELGISLLRQSDRVVEEVASLGGTFQMSMKTVGLEPALAAAHGTAPGQTNPSLEAPVHGPG